MNEQYIRELVDSYCLVNNVTYHFVADKAGISPSTIYMFMHDESKIRFKTAVKIIEAVGYKLEFICTI